MKQAKSQIRVACAGAGYFSQFHYDAWARIDDVEVVGVLALTNAEAEETGHAAYDNLATMLDECRPDLLDIITPPDTHLTFIETALDKGVAAIICQKPFCRNIEEARRAVAMAEAKSVPLIIHENFRFQPWYRVIKTALDKGFIGDLHQITFRLRTGDGQGPNAYLDRQPYFQEMPRLLIHETGVHWIDTFRFLMGPVTGIYADLRRMNPAIVGEDSGYLILEFEGGKRAIFDGNRHLDHSAENHRMTLGECLVEGTTGTITLTGDGCVQHREFGKMNETVLLKPKSWQGFAGDCVYALQSHVVHALQNAGEFENTGADYLSVLEVEVAAYSSNETGKRVRF